MSIHPYISERWSPREFTNKEIPKEQIDILFEAARWAASARNSQPWRFIFATQDQPERWNKLFNCLTESNQKWAITAPMFVLTIVQKYNKQTQTSQKYAWHDLGLAIGNLTLQAMSMNLYVHNMGGFSAERAVELFSIPSNFEPVTMLAIGSIDQEKTKRPEATRRESKFLIFENDWDILE